MTVGSSVGGNSDAQVTAWCPPGKQVIGGGFTNDNLDPIESRPTSDHSGWFIHMRNHYLPPGSWGFTATAICVTAS